MLPAASHLNSVAVVGLDDDLGATDALDRPQRERQQAVRRRDVGNKIIARFDLNTFTRSTRAGASAP